MNNERGVSLIESLLVVVIIGSLVFLMANIPNALNLMTKSKNLSLAREIATKQIEDKRSISFLNLATGTTEIEDMRLSLLPHGSGTVVTQDCDEQICTSGENIKQVGVVVEWIENNQEQSVRLDTFIGEGGLGQ